jgi:phosphopantetheinyl transferase (holo-ACP synthase)
MLVGTGIDLTEIPRIQKSIARVTWLEIEVTREPSGRPGLRFHGRAAQLALRLGVTNAALSLTHTNILAMASVSLEGAPGLPHGA